MSFIVIRNMMTNVDENIKASRWIIEVIVGCFLWHILLTENANGGVDSVTAVLLKEYCIYTKSEQLVKNSYVSKSGRVQEQTLQRVTKQRIELSTLPHWGTLLNQEAITIYKSCQVLCLELWTTMLIRHTYVCFQWNSMAHKNTDYHVLLKPSHCRISWQQYYFALI